MASKARILIVEDDGQARTMLREYLSTHEFEVDEAHDGETMRARLAAQLPDVVLLDIGLPGEDGLALARHLREHYEVGIIMVTGAGDIVDRVVGLEVGADDYIPKPFDPRELRARLKSVLRRMQSRQAGGDSRPAGRSTRAAVGRCVLDLATHQLFDDAGAEIPITGMEFDLLRVFIERPNQVLSRDQLLTLTRNREWEPFDRAIDIRIARLRRKLEPNPDKPRLIKTIRGSGYMFVPGTD
jgi:two-component system phosphate regulon response regulator OmpR